MRIFLREIAVLTVAAAVAAGAGCAGSPPRKEPYPCELAGSVWRPADLRPGAYIEFTPDHRAVGSSGKNRFFAPVKCAPGKRLTVSPVAYTKIRGDLDEWEKRFFEALENTRGYVFDGNKLSLYSEEREKLMEFLMMRPPRGADKR